MSICKLTVTKPVDPIVAKLTGGKQIGLISVLSLIEPPSNLIIAIS